MEKRSYTVARIVTFILSCIIAYGLWTYLRPRFVTTATTDDSCQLAHEELAIHEAETEGTPAEATTTETPVAADQKVATEATAQPVPTTTTPVTTPQTPKAGVSTPSATASAQAVGATRVITVHNGIDKKMLGYKKFGTHYPTTFRITVGNEVLEQDASKKVTVTDNTLKLRYDFEFMNGYRNGAKEVVITLKPTAEIVNLAYDWKCEQRLFVEDDKTASITDEDVPYKK